MPLDGVRVLDFTIWQQGPVASAMLADLGAEVIKVEDPVFGDPGRALAALYGLNGATNPYFENNNRGKKAITLNLKSEKGQEILYRLVRKSDVFVQNFRDGVMDRLGASYGALSELNPRLIYASGCGLGPKGPDRDLPLFDIVAQARGGVASVTGEPHEPPGMIQATGAADAMGAIMLAYGIMTALYTREKTGVGQQVIGSLLGAQIAFGALGLQTYLSTGETPTRLAHNGRTNAMWNFYQTKDERWIVVASLQTDRHWPGLCRVLGLGELVDDPRFNSHAARSENAPELSRIFDARFITKTASEWLTLLHAADIPAGLTQNYEEVANDPMVLANGYVVEVPHPVAGSLKMVGVPIHLSMTPGAVRGAAPEYGQHTEEVLVELCGYDWDEVASFREEGVI